MPSDWDWSPLSYMILIGIVPRFPLITLKQVHMQLHCPDDWLSNWSLERFQILHAPLPLKPSQSAPFLLAPSLLRSIFLLSFMQSYCFCNGEHSQFVTAWIWQLTSGSDSLVCYFFNSWKGCCQNMCFDEYMSKLVLDWGGGGKRKHYWTRFYPEGKWSFGPPYVGDEEAC